MTNAEVNICGYNIVRADRNRSGGGVCTYIRSDIAFSSRSDLHNNKLEAAWTEILLPRSKPIVIGSVYRPPKQADFLDLLQETLQKIDPENELYIFGDPNICLLTHRKLNKKYSNMLNMYHLKQIINEPTRVTINSLY